MLTVVTPATATRLTSFERAKDFLGFDESTDVVADEAIFQASRAAADYCRRPFGRETVRETFRCVDRCGSVLLSRSPVAAFVSVTADGAVLTSADYVLDHATGRLYGADASGPVEWWSSAGLIVTYTAGYVLPEEPNPTLPEAVERAAILLVGMYLSHAGRDPLIKSEEVTGVGSASYWIPASGEALPSPEAESLLQPYRRIFP